MIIKFLSKNIITEPLSTNLTVATEQPHKTHSNENVLTVGSEIEMRDNTTQPLTAYLATMPDTVKKFCERPILIANWQANTQTSISPWQLWGSNAAVAAKLRNFYLVRGKIHMRLVVQAEPFTYGCGIYSLDPSLAAVTTVATYDPLTSAFASDYSVYVDFASDSQPELVMPYIDRIPWIQVVNIGSVSGNVFTYNPIVNPISAQSSTTPTVQINCYAFVTDLEVSIPTAQSAPNNNAMENKPNFRLSSIASKVSTAASIFSDVPLIGPFAATASAVASAIGGVASFFGFSKPLDLTAITKMVVRKTGEMSTADGIDPSFVLSLDSKCEKSLSYQTIVGTNVDQMAFAYALSHWGYISLITWPQTSTEGTNLQAWHVAPGMVVNATSNGWIMTPLAHVALGFAKWSGCLEYKFIVCCSKYHRGRVRIYWNPTEPLTDSPLNTTLCTVLDITPGATTTMVVPWGQQTPAQKVGLFPMSTAVTSSTGTNNGFIWVDVDQQLVVQRSAASAYIIVLVRAGSNFSVYCPTMVNLQHMSISPYSSVAEVSIPVNNSNIIPAGSYTPVLQSAVNELACDDKQATLFNNTEVFGESIGSFRSLCKRYCYYYSYNDTFTTNNFAVYQIGLDRYPAPRQIQTTRFNSGFTWMAYASLAYYFVSGGTRVKIFISPSSNFPQAGPWVASRWKGHMSIGNYTVTTATGNLAQAAGASYTDAAAGGIATATDVTAGNTILEIQIPDQIGYKAEYVNAAFNILNTTYTAKVECVCNDSINTFLSHTTFYAGADDFNLYLYRGPPILYFWGTPTAV